jgi:hypothetical protein
MTLLPSRSETTRNTVDNVFSTCLKSLKLQKNIWEKSTIKCRGERGYMIWIFSPTITISSVSLLLGLGVLLLVTSLSPIRSI